VVELTANECRVLGTLIEKAQTVPGSYPMTLNTLTNGCNQKNARDPVTDLGEDAVYEAVDSLRLKGLVREVILSGSRVAKFRHLVRETYQVGTEELVILAELWLRGPQSAAELRSNASRMSPLESVEAVQTLLDAMAARPEPMVRALSRRPGERTVRFEQLVCPGLHVANAPATPRAVADLPGSADGAGLADRVADLERQLVELKATVDSLAKAVANLGL
jgi:uncharacterized protein YceH (UPF0502 family)